MNVPDRLRAALREIVAPALRAEGFRGSGQTWRLSSADGDVAVVNVQLSQWNNDAEATAYVNLAVLPAAWWAWQRERSGSTAGRLPMETDGLYRARLEPRAGSRSRPGGWECWDEVSARVAAREMRERLVTEAVPLLRALLVRERFAQALRDGEVGDFSGYRGWCDVGLAVVLSDVGGAELDEVCDRLLGAGGSPGWRARAEEVVGWARRRALAE